MLHAGYIVGPLLLLLAAALPPGLADAGLAPATVIAPKHEAKKTAGGPTTTTSAEMGSTPPAFSTM